MNPTQLVLCGATLALAGAAWLAERHVRGKQEAERSKLAAALARSQAEVAQLRDETRLAETALQAQAEARSAAPPPPGALVEQETAAWLARLRELKRVLAERPAARIPEMALLTDRDILLAAREASFGSEDQTRETLARLRTVATRKVAPLLARAVTAYVKEHQNTAPPTLAALTPYLPAPLTPELLTRWQVIGTDVARHVVGEAAAVDADYDTRTVIQGNGGWGGQGPPLAWVPNFAERNKAAHAAYSRAHSGASAASLTALLPFFDPPLTPELEARLRKMEGRR